MTFASMCWQDRCYEQKKTPEQDPRRKRNEQHGYMAEREEGPCQTLKYERGREPVPQPATEQCRYETPDKQSAEYPIKPKRSSLHS